VQSGCEEGENIMSESATGGELSGPGKFAPPVSAEDRRRMVAEAAYYRAAARGFQGGDPWMIG